MSIENKEPRARTVRAASAAAVLSAVVATWILCAPASAAALECPVDHSAPGRNVLVETPRDVARLHSRLEAKGTDAAPTVVAEVRERHPNATNTEIQNYLITAYCPIVNQRTDLSDAVKRAQLAKFGAAISRVLYRPG